jgi:hypothetical protein
VSGASEKRGSAPDTCVAVYTDGIGNGFGHSDGTQRVFPQFVLQRFHKAIAAVGWRPPVIALAGKAARR